MLREHHRAKLRYTACCQRETQRWLSFGARWFPMPTGNLLLPCNKSGVQERTVEVRGSWGGGWAETSGEEERLSSLWSPSDQSNASGLHVETCPETPLLTAGALLSLPRAQRQGRNARSRFLWVWPSERREESTTAFRSTYNVPDITAAAAKLLQLCPTLCDPIDGSPPGSPVPGILQARVLEWGATSFSNAWKWKWSHSRQHLILKSIPSE